VKVIVGPTSQPATTGQLMGHGRVVLFGVPAAFSPTCSDLHLPGFVLRAGDLAAKGVARVFCVSVNDPYVMAAWGRAQGVGDSVTMVSDGNGELTRSLGLELDMRPSFMGTRSRRYAAVLEEGVVTHLGLEARTELESSSAEAVLAMLG
jgi:peroxiredoxin